MTEKCNDCGSFHDPMIRCPNFHAGMYGTGKPTDNTPHEVDLSTVMRIPATELAPGVTLMTRDGHRCGNAIIIKSAGTTSSFPGSRDVIPVWLVETDFGNQMKLTPREIDGMFTIGYVTTYNRWWDDRCDLIREEI